MKRPGESRSTSAFVLAVATSAAAVALAPPPQAPLAVSFGYSTQNGPIGKAAATTASTKAAAHREGASDCDPDAAVGRAASPHPTAE